MAREAERYLGATSTRRGALEASLVNPDNVYSRRRLEALARRERPAVRDGRRPATLAAWIEPGRRVFFELALRPELGLEHALTLMGAAVGPVPRSSASITAAIETSTVCPVSVRSGVVSGAGVLPHDSVTADRGEQGRRSGQDWVA